MLITKIVNDYVARASPKNKHAIALQLNQESVPLQHQQSKFDSVWWNDVFCPCGNLTGNLNFLNNSETDLAKYKISTLLIGRKGYVAQTNWFYEAHVLRTDGHIMTSYYSTMQL